MNYSKLAFTEVIKELQEAAGSRETYERVERHSYKDGLTPVEQEFIGRIDSFYLASFGDNDFPYIQHRGGPKGFIKVIDPQTLGIVDFAGNRQYISVGNIAHHENVSLILVSYPLRARLKFYARAEVLGIEDRPDLYEFLKPIGYKFKAERLIVFHIEAYDWNCPQHIHPKYSMEEVEAMMAEKDRYINELEREVAVLRRDKKTRG